MTIQISDRIDWTMSDAPNKSGGFNKPKNDWVVPSGEYTCEILSTQMRSAADNKYTYMEMKFEVSSPQNFKGKMFYIKFYFKHDDYPALVAKNMKQLRELSLACFNKIVETGADFVGGKCHLTLTMKPGNPKPDGGTYPANNRIEKIAPIKSALPVEDPQVAVPFTDEIPW